MRPATCRAQRCCPRLTRSPDACPHACLHERAFSCVACLPEHACIRRHACLHLPAAPEHPGPPTPHACPLQRDKVYGERRRALEAADLTPLMVEYAERTIDDILEVRSWCFCLRIRRGAAAAAAALLLVSDAPAPLPVHHVPARACACAPTCHPPGSICQAPACFRRHLLSLPLCSPASAYAGQHPAVHPGRGVAPGAPCRQAAAVLLPAGRPHARGAGGGGGGGTMTRCGATCGGCCCARCVCCGRLRVLPRWRRSSVGGGSRDEGQDGGRQHCWLMSGRAPESLAAAAAAAGAHEKMRRLVVRQPACLPAGRPRVYRRRLLACLSPPA